MLLLPYFEINNNITKNYEFIKGKIAVLAAFFAYIYAHK